MKQVIIAISILFLHMSCVSNPSTGEVIERSSEVTPQWANGNFAQFEGKRDYLLKFSARNIQPLDLGVKQAQALAINQTQGLFNERCLLDFRELLKEYRKSSKQFSTEDEQEALRKAGEALGRVKVADATPRSVYWEKQKVEKSTEPAYEYHIFILLALPRSEFHGAMAQISATLESSPMPNVKKFGQWIANMKSLN